jgi:hypothetical protein
MKNIENKLNKEYEHIGVISIRKSHDEIFDISEIEYIESIMDKISPLKNDEPVVLAKKYSWEEKYKIIDGYHRIKDKLSNRESSINAIILDDYSIKRKTDNLFDFLKGLLGKEITFIDSNLFITDGHYYQIVENEGCGGCGNGWSSIEVLPEYINKKIKIKKIASVGDEDSDEYDLVINDKKIAKVDTGWGNGYYGGDFEVNIIV